MELTENKIKLMSSEEYLKHRKEIREFYKNKREKEKKYQKKYHKNHKKKTKIDRYFYKRQGDGKICVQCGSFKGWNGFTKDKKKKDGYKHKCKECLYFRIKIKRLTDTNYRITQNLRNRLYAVLKNNKKYKSTLELLGCSVDFLKKHLESKFKHGMTWDNYGKWHIDHIKPCSTFDLSKKTEQLQCFHYTNLQPLWAKENLMKSNK